MAYILSWLQFQGDIEEFLGKGLEKSIWTLMGSTLITLPMSVESFFHSYPRTIANSLAISWSHIICMLSENPDKL